MGVPKFFRWLSERYPAISQLIAENRIPEFDCLYLDMNGIIHNCTHKDSDSPTFRMTEEQMFIGIFNYIEHLFRKIKPKQLFFMAVDGVAPRAKMNQQRARRFRTALDAEKAREKAIRDGVEMPKEDAFDSNCITPGTEFMAKLTKQLKYFINKKVSEDSDWQKVEIVLSGHEVPGEGEHKIMEYIRQAKAQPDYNPNVRHCLYGLDADLIMLGLLSHDPHFCLLREEVTFGRNSHRKTKELEYQNFYLMHLSIVREYLELEFQELKEPGTLNFPFDMEKVIDDFILMAFFVGNDFLPNLPNLHINEGALALMFKMYKEVLPTAGGYINEGGVINLKRLELLLDRLSAVENRFFEVENADAAWFKGKRMGRIDVMEPQNKRGELSITSRQREIFLQVKEYVTNSSLGTGATLSLGSSLPASDRKFVGDLAASLHLQQTRNGDDLQLALPSMPDDEDDNNDEAKIAINRVLKRYEMAKIEDITAEQARQDADMKYEARFQDWKNNYYESKFGWGLDNKEELKKLTENYVQGLQWVLYYYYRGIASWPWFFGSHYAPMISDVKFGLDADMNFELGQPFRPFQQLMGVLPDRSKKIVPPAYWDLMTSSESPIIDFYPREFELDMNGKKMDWEAVVKIPFIDERRLLDAMKAKEHLLTEEEKSRNSFGTSLKFSYSLDVQFEYESSLPGIFPNLPYCHCVENIFELPTMEGLEPHVGLMDGVKLGVEALAGFPSLKTLSYVGGLAFHGVNVFQQDSRNESMVITLTEEEQQRTNVEVAKTKLGQRAYVGYPYLQEARIVRISDELFDYVLANDGSGQTISIPHNGRSIADWHKKAEKLENFFSKRLGIVIGTVESMTHVEMLKGLKKLDDGSTVKEYAEIPGIDPDHASQTIVDEVVSEDPRFIEKPALSIEEEYPEGSRAFFLGEFNYGRPLEILKHEGNKVEVWVSVVKGKEREFGREIAMAAEEAVKYVPSYTIARMLNLNPLVLSKITSSFTVMSDGQRINLGLNLKFEAKKMKVLGYSRRGDSGWEFSKKAIDLLEEYMITFPEFIAAIQQSPHTNIFSSTDIYQEDVAAARIKQIQAWLKSIASKEFEQVPVEAEQLDSDIVKLMEQAADDFVKNGPVVESKKIKGVPRNALLNPADTEQQLLNQRFVVGDRVVYVQDSGRVPIGTRGTVVGKTRTSRTTLLDILFDVTFMSGTTLGDRCSPFRGSTVPVSTVLNLTDKQFIAGSKAAVERGPISRPYSMASQSSDALTGPQLQPAATPKALAGTFSNAVKGAPGGAGRHRRRGNGSDATQGGLRNESINSLPFRHSYSESNVYRGRGNRHSNAGGAASRRGIGYVPRGRGGYISVERQDFDAGVVHNNPDFHPQPFHNVPPPAILNSTSHRGRGSGSVRGDSTRGRGGKGYFHGRGTVVVKPE